MQLGSGIGQDMLPDARLVLGCGALLFGAILIGTREHWKLDFGGLFGHLGEDG